jgi:hypothetical protein
MRFKEFRGGRVETPTSFELPLRASMNVPSSTAKSANGYTVFPTLKGEDFFSERSTFLPES